MRNLNIMRLVYWVNVSERSGAGSPGLSWITDRFGLQPQTNLSWLRGTVVERRSLTGELSLLSYARPAADG